MKMLAEHLDVSLSTVARSLKDGSRISPETVKRVQAAAAQLGYVRNLDGVRLRTGKSFVIMAFLSASAEEEVGDSGSVGLLHGIHKRLAGTDYALRTVHVEHGEERVDILSDVVKGRMADGVILDHTSPQDARAKYLLEEKMPFVTFGRTELFTPHAYFDIDNEYAAWLETTTLIGHGARRIGLLNGEAEYTYVKQRTQGYRQALADCGISFNPAFVRNLSSSATVARQAARELVSGHQVDALVCFNEIAFLGARAGVRELGSDTLECTAFAVRSGTNIVDYLGTPAVCTYYARADSGWHLADSLLQLLDGTDPADLCQVVKPVLKDYSLFVST